MEIGEQIKGAVRILAPHGPISGTDADQLKARALEAVGAGLGRVVLDAAAVPFADSRGLEILAELSDELAQSGLVLKLSGVTETLREILDLTDLASRMEIYEDTTSAVRSFL